MKIRFNRFTAILTASLIPVGGVALAQAPATPPPAPPAAKTSASAQVLDLSKLITPETMAAVGAMLKQHAPDKANPQDIDLNGLLKGLGENGEIQKLLTPENLSALGAMLKPLAADDQDQPAPAPDKAPAPDTDEPDLGALLKGLGENGEIQKLLTPENLSALGAMLKPLAAASQDQPAPAPDKAPAPDTDEPDLGALLKGHNLEGLLKQAQGAGDQPAPGIRVFAFQAGSDGSFKMLGNHQGNHHKRGCDKGADATAPDAADPSALLKNLLQGNAPKAKDGESCCEMKIMMMGPDGVTKELNIGDIGQLLQGFDAGEMLKNLGLDQAQAAPAPAPAPEAAPAPDAARRARIEALLDELRKELLK